MSCRIITLTAGSSSGKDAILNAVLRANDKVQVIVSTTSRPMRIGEIDGVTYNFVSDKKAKQMLKDGEFIERRVYNVIEKSENKKMNILGKWLKLLNMEQKTQWIYGITKDSIDVNSDKVYIVIVDFQGLKALEKYLKQFDIEVESIFVDCSAQERLRRSISREGKMTTKQVEECCRRLIADENEVIKQAGTHCKYILTNETKEKFIQCVLFISNLIGE